MNLKNRWLWFGMLGLLGLVLLSFFFAPRGPNLQQGSTYNRAPDGYGAWYAAMEQQGTPIQRWQKPLGQFFDAAVPSATEISQRQDSATPDSIAQSSPKTASPRTLVRISHGLSQLRIDNPDWISSGNVLVLVGVQAPVTQAPFRSSLSSSAGLITLETSRRFPSDRSTSDPDQPRGSTQSLLRDAYGSVVLKAQIGQGQVIWIAAPHFAANAYQDEPGNFKFLTQLVTQPGYPIWVDEYLHGYKDQAVIQQETSRSLLRYLFSTPLLIVAVQAGVLFLVLIWTHNQRLGAPIPLETTPEDNSAAYIQALATVLQKSHSSDFVVETVSRAEQLRVQRSLGLGAELLAPETVINAWHQQTGRPASELASLLQPQEQNSGRSGARRRLSEQELLTWLRTIPLIRQQLKD